MPLLATTNIGLEPSSVIEREGFEYGLVRSGGALRLAVLSASGSDQLRLFEGERTELAGRTLLTGPLSAHNAAALRSRLPCLRPRPLGLRTTAGMGDRLGVATRGHVRAVRATGGKISPIFAQQSMREMARTGREPQQVLDDATWGAFAEGWQDDLGADADHLKTTADIDRCLSAGFTLFTIDPGAYVNNDTSSASMGVLRELTQQLPEQVQPRKSGLQDRTLHAEELAVVFNEGELLRCAVKYGAAIAHVAEMFRHLEAAAAGRPFEMEVSVDETEQPTSHAEHLYIACELKRLGVRWVSLAPRYVGRFEKGVDYIGDIRTFEKDMAGHAAIARTLGPYKLSLHSGSDKFRIYDIAMRETRGMVHLKTAGTSYLEALRTLGAVEPELLREIYAFARGRYATDRASYHVSAEIRRAPSPEAVRDWAELLDDFDAREILHVTYGSVLTEKSQSGTLLFAIRLMDALRRNEELYAANLQRHFIRHLQPFSERGGDHG